MGTMPEVTQGVELGSSIIITIIITIIIIIIIIQLHIPRKPGSPQSITFCNSLEQAYGSATG